MALDVASLVLSVESTQGVAGVDRLAESLRKAGLSATEVEKALAAAEHSAATFGTQTAQLENRINSYIASENKQFAATLKMIEGQSLLAQAQALPLGNMGLLEKAIASAGAGAEKSTLSFATLGRELRAMIDEALSGRWQNFQGTAARLFGTIAQGRPDLIAAAVGFGAFAAPLALATASVVAYETSIRALDIALRATGDVSTLTRVQLNDLARETSASTTTTIAGARELEAAFIRAGASGDALKSMVLITADVAAGMGVKVPEASKLLVKALESPMATAQQLNSTYLHLTAAQLDYVDALEKSGQRSAAAQVIFRALGDNMRGMSEEAIGFGATWDRVTKAFSDSFQVWGERLTRGGLADWAESNNRSMDSFLAKVNDVGHGVTLFLDNLDRAWLRSVDAFQSFLHDLASGRLDLSGYATAINEWLDSLDKAWADGLDHFTQFLVDLASGKIDFSGYTQQVNQWLDDLDKSFASAFDRITARLGKIAAAAAKSSLAEPGAAGAAFGEPTLPELQGAGGPLRGPQLQEEATQANALTEAYRAVVQAITAVQTAEGAATTAAILAAGAEANSARAVKQATDDTVETLRVLSASWQAIRDREAGVYRDRQALIEPTNALKAADNALVDILDKDIARLTEVGQSTDALIKLRGQLAAQSAALLDPEQKLAQQLQNTIEVMALTPSQRAARQAQLTQQQAAEKEGRGGPQGSAEREGATAGRIVRTTQEQSVDDALVLAKQRSADQHRILQQEIGDRDVLRARLEAEAAARKLTDDQVKISAAGNEAAKQALEARSGAIDDIIKKEGIQLDIDAQVFGAELRDRDLLRAKLEAEATAREKSMGAAQAATFVADAQLRVIQKQESVAKDNADAIEREIASAGRLGEAYRTSSEAVALVTAQEAAHEAFLKNLTNDESAYTDTLLKRAAAQSSLKVDQSIAAMHDQEAAMKGVSAAQLVGAGAAQKLLDSNKLELEFEKEAAPIRALLIKAQLDDNKDLAADAQATLDKILAAQDQLRKGKAALSEDAITGSLNVEIKAAKDANALLQKEVDLANELPDVRAREVAQLRLKLELENKFGPGHEAEKQQLLDNLDIQMRLTAEVEKMRAAREQVQQPFLDAVGSIKDAFVGLFEGIFSGGVDTFKKFGETVKNIFIHLAAQIAEMMVIQPILNSVVGGITGVAPGFTNPLMMAQMLGGGGFNAGQFGVSGAGAGVQGAGGLFYGGGSALGGIGATGDLGGYGGTAFGGAGSALGGVDPSMASAAGGTAGMFGGSLMGIIGGGALGFGAGSALGGGTLTGDIGAGGGALAGAALGSFLFPGVGTLLGGLLGGLAGGGLGGMFGPGPTSSAAGFNLDTSGAQTSFAAKGGANVAAAQSLSTSLSGLIQQINQLTGGGHLAGGYHLGGDVSTAGPRTYIAGDDASWQFFTGPNAAKDAANRVLQLLAGSADKLTETVAHHSTVDTLQANIQFLNDVYKPLIAGKDAATGMTKAVQDLTKQFTDAKTAAAGLGLSVDGLNDALTKAIAKMRTDFDKDISQQILEIKDPLAASLAKLDDWKKQALEDAAAVGGNIVNIEELYGLKRQQIIDQQNQVITNSVSTMKDTIQSMLDALTGAGPGSLLSPGEQYAAGKAAFEAAAKQGTEEGTLPKDFAAITSQFLDASKAMFATTAAFAADQKEVTDVLQELLGLPKAAAGGYVSGVTIVGERGPEVVDFRGGAHVTASGQGSANDNGDVVAAITALHRTTQDYTLRLGQIADAQTRLTKRFDLLASGMATPGGRPMFQRRASQS